MDSKNIAQALTTLDDLFTDKESFKHWLSSDTLPQDRYHEAKRKLEATLPGLCVKRVDLHYRYAHVLAPIDL